MKKLNLPTDAVVRRRVLRALVALTKLPRETAKELVAARKAKIKKLCMEVQGLPAPADAFRR